MNKITILVLLIVPTLITAECEVMGSLAYCNTPADACALVDDVMMVVITSAPSAIPCVLRFPRVGWMAFNRNDASWDTSVNIESVPINETFKMADLKVTEEGLEDEYLTDSDPVGLKHVVSATWKAISQGNLAAPVVLDENSFYNVEDLPSPPTPLSTETATVKEQESFYDVTTSSASATSLEFTSAEAPWSKATVTSSSAPLVTTHSLPVVPVVAYTASTATIAGYVAVGIGLLGLLLSLSVMLIFRYFNRQPNMADTLAAGPNPIPNMHTLRRPWLARPVYPGADIEMMERQPVESRRSSTANNELDVTQDAVISSSEDTLPTSSSVVEPTTTTPAVLAAVPLEKSTEL